MPKQPKIMTEEEKNRCTEIDLPDLIAYRIESDIYEDRFYVIPKKYFPYTDVRPTCPFPGCPGNGSSNVRIKDYKERNVMDMPRYGKPSRLILRVPRYICNDCNNPFSTPFESVGLRDRVTSRLLSFIQKEAYELIPFSDIARRVGLEESGVVRICDEYLQNALAGYTLEFPEVIGVDEDHFKTYENDYSFIITDPVKMKILDLWPSREKQYIMDEFRKLDGREKVIGVTMDMSSVYRDVVEKMFPNASVVCDRFHVIKLITKKLIEIKDNVLDSYKVKYKGDRKKIKEIENDFSVIRDLMLINQEDLSDKAKTKLGQLLAKYEEMSVAYLLKEEFRDIYSLSKNRKEAIKRYNDWANGIRDDNPLFKPFVELRDGTFKNWRMEFLNYFDFKEKGMPVSNGPTEGLNSVVKSIMRTGRGYMKFNVLRAKCVLGGDIRYDRLITDKMQRLKKKLMRKGVTEPKLFENEALRAAADEAEQERRKRRRDQKAKRGTWSKLKRRALSDDSEDEPPAPEDLRKSTHPIQGEFDFGLREE